MAGIGAGAPFGITLDELRARLRAVEPNAVLVPPRILRRVIKHDRKITSLGLLVPHRKSYALDAAAATAIMERDELGLDVDAEAALTGAVYLIAEPDPRKLARMTAGQALMKSWRLLFHARVDRALDERRRSGALDEAALRSRIDRIGTARFDEARAVLRYEDYLMPPRDEWEAYREFAAVYLEVRHFAPRLLPSYFPAIDDPEAIDAVLAEDVDADRLFARTRPSGAPDPEAIDALIDAADHFGEAPAPDGTAESVGTCPLPSPEPRRRLAERLVRRSEGPGRRGNLVRAAILCARATRFIDPLGPPLASEPWARARELLGRLGERLVRALGLPPDEADAWRFALPALLAPASEGIWAVEARLLFDLQKLCVDYERPIYTVDPVEWMLSLGKRPVKRLLPFQRELLAVKHLRSARRRLQLARISETDRARLHERMAEALQRAEATLRERCRPAIAETLRETGFEPGNVPESVSSDKIVEELLDKVVEAGYLTMGDLRDAIARNQVKLPDLAGAGEFFRGDRLLQANRRMATAMDGIYRRGEVYLRWLQRFSSLGFGTPAGRFLTQYVVLPFVGAFVVLFFVDHLVHEATKQLGYGVVPAGVATAAVAPLAAVGDGLAGGAGRIVGAAATASLADPRGLHLFPHDAFPWVTLAAGAFLFGLIHLPRFRRQVAWFLRAFFDVAKGFLFDLPHWVLNLRSVRRLIATRGFQFLWRIMVKPLVPAFLAYAAFRLVGLDRGDAGQGAFSVFIAVALLLNLRIGRDMEEIASDYLVNTWNVIRVNILGDLYRAVMDFFGRVLENVDRLLYTVDEWLRFRGGEGGGSLVLKATLGVFWFYVTYVVRFIINLLVEPQINPIKHFPVVTVSHKVMFPFLLYMIPLLTPTFGKETATTVWSITQLLLPGVVGFIVWELKENWRLYAANRPRELPRVLVGSHGETMSRLLRPGLHSGTLPKLYHRLRRASRRVARRPDGGVRLRRLREHRHHVEQAIAHFVERELLNLLARTRAWGDVEAAVVAVETSTNRVRVAIACPQLGDDPLVVGYDHDSGWIAADAGPASFLERLTDDRRQVLQAALAGLNQMADADLARTQAEHLLPPRARCYDIDDAGLVVWIGDRYETEATYALDGDYRKIAPTIAGPRPVPPLPSLPADRLLLARDPIAWSLWVATWEAEQDGEPPRDPFVKAMRLLPAPEQTGATT